jgi:hypothetical protein
VPPNDPSVTDLVRRAAEGDQRAWEARAEALAQALDAARARAGAERLAGVAGGQLELRWADA